jgi:plasmid maintenance system antidote protein VapI
MAPRLPRFVRATPEFWMNLQTHYDLEVARDKEQRKVDEEVWPVAVSA